MKTLILFTLLSLGLIICGCKNENEGKFSNEKLYGNIKEIHTYSFFENDNKVFDNKPFDKVLDSLDKGGKIIKSYKYDRDYLNDDYKKMDELILSTIILYEYEKNILKKQTIIDLIYNNSTYSDYEFQKNNYIVRSFNKTKNLNGYSNIFLNNEALISSQTWMNRDSIFSQKNYNSYNERGFLKSVICYDSLNKKNAELNYNYLKFDKNGNWIERIQYFKDNKNKFKQLIKRDIFYYSN